jgi:hypothetical protein
MPDTLACLASLMVAQAQEVIYIKAKRGHFTFILPYLLPL